MLTRLRTYLQAPLSIAPLATFRVLFGGIMAVSVLRFVLNGWVDELYVRPGFFFSYYGFEWIKPLGATGMYLMFALMGLSALGVMLGAFYRVSAPLFFLSFSYVELLDKTNYLNHYYFVSIVALLLMLVPAHRYFSVDAWLRPEIARSHVPRWMVGIFRFQLGLVYVFAGLAKLNPDWLFQAMPLKIWLPAKSHLPLVGPMLEWEWVAFAFCWFGAIYDLTIPFFLSMRRTRVYAFMAVVVFHLMTWWLFQIGMFPFIMILGSLVFFPAAWHQKLIQGLRNFLAQRELPPISIAGKAVFRPARALGIGLIFFFSLQILMPFRYLLYPGDLFWTEQGYRFSWRVMLMEKAGHATFRVRDPRTGGESEIINSQYLTPNQEKMMSTQPDMLLQYAHFLKGEYQRQGIPDPAVYADVFVSLNGRGSRRFIDPSRDLSKIREGFQHKDWVLPFEADNFAAR